MRGRHVGVFRVDHQRYAEGLEAATGQLGPVSAGRRRQAGTEHVGEVDAALLDQRPVFDDPGTTAATGGALPGILAENGLAVLALQGGADAILQIEQIGLHGLGTVSHGGTLNGSEYEIGGQHSTPTPPLAVDAALSALLDRVFLRPRTDSSRATRSPKWPSASSSASTAAARSFTIATTSPPRPVREKCGWPTRPSA